MKVQDILPTGTYTITNASTNEYIAVQGPTKAATLGVSRDGSTESAAVRIRDHVEEVSKANLNIMQWVLERLSGHRDKYNIRSFTQNSYVAVNSAQKTNAIHTLGREACPWSIRPTGYGTYVFVFHRSFVAYYLTDSSPGYHHIPTLRPIGASRKMRVTHRY